MYRLAYTLRVIGAMALKDIRSALTERAFTMLGVIIPINFLLLFLLFVLTGGEAPTAVVLQDQGPYAQRFVAAMRQAHSFIVQETTAADAQSLMRQGRIVAIVTVPRDFDVALQAGRSIELPVEVNNLDVDFTNDIRRAVPLAITSFYADAFPDQVVVRAHEIDAYAHDTGYVQYLAVSLLVIAIMLGGLLQAGTAAAREYETGTIKELMLAPAAAWAIEAGKVLGALVMNMLSVAVILVVIVFVLGIRPAHWGEVLGYSLLLMITFVALGTLLGTLVRRRQAIIPLSLGLALPLFFLSGAFGPAVWGNPVEAAAARLQPVYYGIAVAQHAFHNFETTPTTVAANGAILAAFAVAAVLASGLALSRRGGAQ